MGNILEDINKSTNDANNTNGMNEEEIIDIKDDKKFIWIDPEIENEENKYHYTHIFEEKNINCKKFDNIDESFNYLKGENNFFKEIVIIISGKLFNNFYHKFLLNIKSFKFSPTIIIFTHKRNMCINQLKMNNIYYNNDLFNTKMILTNHEQMKDYIENNFQLEPKELTFDLIEDLEQLIIPNYYTYLLEDVNKSEINYFNDYLIRNFLMHINLDKEGKYKKGIIEMSKLINQIKNKNLPKEILIKYWIRIYSLQTKYFLNNNKSLRYKDENAYFYFPFVKLCYEGIKKNFIKSYDKEIYRYSLISKDEFEELKNKFNTNNTIKQKNYYFPNLIVFTRSFLSFSEEERTIESFKRQSDENSYSVLYIIEEIKNDKKKMLSNSVIEEFSFYPKEKEILVFPFTCFEIINITEINKNDIKYEIRLKYLGNYSEYIKEQLGKNFFDKIQISIFSEELMNSGILKIENFFSTWKKHKKYEIKLDKICFFLENNEDFIGFNKNKILIYNIITSNIKQEIIIHKEQIINIIELKGNKICSYSKDGKIIIMKLINNNSGCEIINDKINLYNNYAKQILFFENDDFLCLDSLNDFIYYKFDNIKYNIKNVIKENDKILLLKELVINENIEPNGKNENCYKIVYICENQAGNKFVKFIKLNNKGEKIKAYNPILIKEETNKKLILIDLLVFNNYFIIGYNSRIDIIYDNQGTLNTNSLNFFDYEIINITLLSSNRIILGLYDSEKKESIIREHLLRIKDVKNNIERFDCIGQGILESKKIDNIIKINEAQILINIKNDSLFIYERTNEISEKLKAKLNLINSKNQELIEKTKTNINNSKIINTHFSLLKTERHSHNHQKEKEYLNTKSTEITNMDNQIKTNQRQDLDNLFPRVPKENLGNDNGKININNRSKTLQKKNFYFSENTNK